MKPRYGFPTKLHKKDRTPRWNYKPKLRLVESQPMPRLDRALVWTVIGSGVVYLGMTLWIWGSA
jgi:hypothetical protein